MTGANQTAERAVSARDKELDAREARARLKLQKAADLEQEATRELDRVYWARRGARRGGDGAWEARE
jgi:hypothetical protein